jgi:hypothetical protein
MQTPEYTIEALANRVAKLEAQSRRLKKMGIASLVAAAVVIAMGQAPIKKVIEANEFVLQDSSGKARAKLLIDSSGTPSLEFDDLGGKVSAQYRSGDLMITGEEGGSRLTKDHFMIATPEGHIDFETKPLRLKITNTSNKGFGYASLGIGSSMKHEGVLGPALVLFGNKGQGFAQLDTADGPARLHFEPGMWDGKVLSGGFVDITSDGPLIQLSDQQGLTTGIGQFGLEDKQTGKIIKTGAASIVLAGKDKVLWSAP